MVKTWSVYGSTQNGRLFIESHPNCGMPSLRLCIVSDGHPPSAAWLTIDPDLIADLRTALEAAIAHMSERG